MLPTQMSHSMMYENEKHRTPYPQSLRAFLYLAVVKKLQNKSTFQVANFYVHPALRHTIQSPPDFVLRVPPSRAFVGRLRRRRTRSFATGDVIKVTAAAVAAAAIVMHPTLNRSIAAAPPPPPPPSPLHRGPEWRDLSSRARGLPRSIWLKRRCRRR